MWGGNRRQRRVRLGVLLLLLGALWLGKAAGWIPPVLFGPLVVILLGLWLVGVALSKRPAL